MEKKAEQSVEKNYIYNLVYQMLLVAVPLLVTPYVSRVLGAEGIGAFSYTSAITGYFLLAGNLGVSTYGQLQIASCRNDRERMSQTFFELVLLRFILMLLTACAFLFFIRFFSEEKYKTLYYVLFVHVIANALDISWLLQGLEHFKKIVLRNIIIKIIGLILIFSFVKRPSDLHLYAFIMNGSTLLGNISIWFFVPSLTSTVQIHKLRPFSHLRKCFVYFIPTIATTIYLTLDKSMIGWFTETSFENGYYEQTHKIEQMAVTVVTSLSIVTMPRMAFLFHNHEIDKLKDRLNKTIQFILLISIPMCLGLMAISDYFIPLFLGAEFNKSITLLKVFSLLIVVVGLNNAVGKQVLMPIGRQKKYNISVIFGAIINFMLNYMLIPRYFSIGASIASVISETAILCFFIHYSRDYISPSFILKSSGKYLVSGIIMYLIIRASYHFLNMNWMNLILQIVLGMLSYGVCVIVLRDRFVIDNIKQFYSLLSHK